MDTIKQSKNIVKISGILLNNDLHSRTSATGNFISGSIIIRVNQTISGNEEVSDIPVNIFASEFTKNGNPNPAYADAAFILNSAISLNAAEDPTTASKIVVTNGSLKENYYSPDGQNVHCTPRINGSFMKVATGGSLLTNFKPSTEFLVDMVVGNIEDEINAENIAARRLKVKGMVCAYNGAMENFDFIVENPNAINYIKSYWQIGDTVQISGKIRYTFKTEQIEIPTRFGDPVFKNKTTTCKEFIITADSSDVLTPEQKFTEDEIRNGLNIRNTLIEKARTTPSKSGNGGNIQSAPAQKANPYGF